jgi:hypothetical protein
VASTGLSRYCLLAAQSGALSRRLPRRRSPGWVRRRLPGRRTTGGPAARAPRARICLRIAVSPHGRVRSRTVRPRRSPQSPGRPPCAAASTARCSLPPCRPPHQPPHHESRSRTSRSRAPTDRSAHRRGRPRSHGSGFQCATPSGCVVVRMGRLAASRRSRLSARRRTRPADLPRELEDIGICPETVLTLGEVKFGRGNDEADQTHPGWGSTC